jgi:hypothetical protein
VSGISGVHTIRTTGQLIPFVIGVASLIVAARDLVMLSLKKVSSRRYCCLEHAERTLTFSRHPRNIPGGTDTTSRSSSVCLALRFRSSTMTTRLSRRCPGHTRRAPLATRPLDCLFMEIWSSGSCTHVWRMSTTIESLSSETSHKNKKSSQQVAPPLLATPTPLVNHPISSPRASRPTPPPPQHDTDQSHPADNKPSTNHPESHPLGQLTRQIPRKKRHPMTHIRLKRIRNRSKTLHTARALLIRTDNIVLLLENELARALDGYERPGGVVGVVGQGDFFRPGVAEF